MPGSDESIRYLGDNYCLAGALLHSAKTGFPLLNDTPGLAVPLIFVGQDNDKAKHLAAMLAIECVKARAAGIVLRPEDLMEFRVENSAELRVFRRSLPRYAGGA